MASSDGAVKDVNDFIKNMEKKFGQLLPVDPDTFESTQEKAKRDLRFLLVYLHENDNLNVEKWFRNTLGTKEVIDFIKENKILFWACDKSSQEGSKVKQMFKVECFPYFGMIVARQDKMTLVGELKDFQSAQSLCKNLKNMMEDNKKFIEEALLQRKKDEEARKECKRSSEAADSHLPEKQICYEKDKNSQEHPVDYSSGANHSNDSKKDSADNSSVASETESDPEILDEKYSDRIYSSPMEFDSSSKSHILTTVNYKLKTDFRFFEKVLLNTTGVYKIKFEYKVCSINGKENEEGFVEFFNNFVNSNFNKNEKLMDQTKRKLETVLKKLREAFKSYTDLIMTKESKKFRVYFKCWIYYSKY